MLEVTKEVLEFNSRILHTEVKHSYSVSEEAKASLGAEQVLLIMHVCEREIMIDPNTNIIIYLNPSSDGDDNMYSVGVHKCWYDNHGDDSEWIDCTESLIGTINAFQSSHIERIKTLNLARFEYFENV